ncbi:MAG: hypothetical protein ABR961_13465 [Thermoanaerobaculaceae bacterium]
MHEDAPDHRGEKLAGHVEVGVEDLVKVLEGILDESCVDCEALGLTLECGDGLAALLEFRVFLGNEPGDIVEHLLVECHS